MRTKPSRPFRNLGPRSTAWLQEAGITTLEELRELGAVEAFARVKARGRGVSLLLLYALQGALLDCHWNDLPPGMREALRDEAEALGGEGRPTAHPAQGTQG